MVLEQLDIHTQNNLGTDLITVTQINSKCTDLSVKHTTIKLENRIGENLDDLGHGDAFLDKTPKT